MIWECGCQPPVADCPLRCYLLILAYRNVRQPKAIAICACRRITIENRVYGGSATASCGGHGELTCQCWPRYLNRYIILRDIGALNRHATYIDTTQSIGAVQPFISIADAITDVPPGLWPW